MIGGLKLNPYEDLQEIDLRSEVIDFILGADFGNSKYTPYIFREKRQLENGKPDRCHCWNKKSNEGRVGCGDCDGEGVLWDEKIIPGILYYITSKSLADVFKLSENFGRSENMYVGFITPFDEFIKPDDHIILPKLNNEGAFNIPYQEDERYYVNQSRKFKLDNGQKEYGGAIMTRVS